ncbi:MAG: transposase [Dehalococcoidia bacterium]|nr:transposase [Dehalococcoidia bacterium]
MYDGADRSNPCLSQLDAGGCFVPLMRWLLDLWRSDTLALAIDPTMKGDRINALVISVVYRSCAIPVAWHILPANRPGGWVGPIADMLRTVSQAVPEEMMVVVMCDRGLRSRHLWDQICSLGWHPYVRQSINTVFCPDAGTRLSARYLVPGQGHAWIGKGTAFRAPGKHRRGTMIVVWDTEQSEPWIVMTDLSAAEAGVCWYGLRFWIEVGFRALKSMGFKWDRTRREHPERVCRHWLVLSVATLWTLAYGTRAEDASDLGIAPSRLRSAPKELSPKHRSAPRRIVSVLSLGMSWLRRLLSRGRLWQKVWLLPESWPKPPPYMKLIYHEHT